MRQPPPLRDSGACGDEAMRLYCHHCHREDGFLARVVWAPTESADVLCLSCLVAEAARSRPQLKPPSASSPTEPHEFRCACSPPYPCTSDTHRCDECLRVRSAHKEAKG